jgi:hypothetical protein
MARFNAAPKITRKGGAKVDPSGPHVAPEHLNQYIGRRPIVPGGKRKQLFKRRETGCMGGSWLAGVQAFVLFISLLGLVRRGFLTAMYAGQSTASLRHL